VQITVLPSATVGMIAQLVRLDPNASIQAHAGNGVICLRHGEATAAQVTTTDRAEGTSLQAANGFLPLLRGQLRPAVAAAGGTLVVRSCMEHAELTCADVWGPPGAGATLMRSIKDRFDPRGVLNPGRFVFE
jgi:FAD/FMN-containing dehydrogenase